MFLDRPPGLDFLTAEAEMEIEKVRSIRDEMNLEIRGYQNQEKLRVMIVTRAEQAARHLNMKSGKDICGYDNRLAMNEAEFASWSATQEGKTALESGVLGPRTAETMSIGAHVPMPGQVVPEVPHVPDVLHNICTKTAKKCIKHQGWSLVHKDSFAFSYNDLFRQVKWFLEIEALIIDDAETREATKDLYSDNVTIQLF